MIEPELRCVGCCVQPALLSGDLALLGVDIQEVQAPFGVEPLLTWIDVVHFEKKPVMKPSARRDRGLA